MRRLGSILFWSILAAAFIGPGTVTTCGASGARFGLGLLWALVFSTFGCLVLQEAAARVTIVTGLDLAQAVRRLTPGSRGLAPMVLVLGAIVLGCAAYQTGNILGAVAGASLSGWGSPRGWTIAISLIAFTLLWGGRTRLVAMTLGVVVAGMGLAFLATAATLRPDPGALVSGALIPRLPPGSGLLIVGLVGTTIVPYNLFLGSGIAKGHSLGDMRFGLSVSILLGGLISMAVVVVGQAGDGPFAFEGLAGTLRDAGGPWLAHLFAFGLFCAGFSSAVTAPLAAAVTARGLFGADDWVADGWRFRGVWLFVLLAGLLFGLLEIRPVPAILLAQALNGLLLPLVAAFLLVVVNDRRLMGHALNGVASNAALGVTWAITVLLGLTNLLRAATATFGGTGGASLSERVLFGSAAALTLVSALPLALLILRRRGADAN